MPAATYRSIPQKEHPMSFQALKKPAQENPAQENPAEANPAEAKPAQADWRSTLAEIGPLLAEEDRRCDEMNQFVGANLALLRERGFLELAVPVELGGGGFTRTELSGMLQTLARHSSSTALALAMHTHVLAATVWRWRYQNAPVEGL